MSMVINGTSGITFPDGSLQGIGVGRNRIINGDMRIAQRGTAAVTTSNTFPVDRFLCGFSTDGAFSGQQDSSAPVGFVNSFKWTTTTADASLSASQFCQFRQAIEGTNVSDLAWGTANAKTVTVSFWVRSSLTGTFAGSLRNSAANRSYVFTYTISAADTWEYKTVTIAGDTSGTWLTTTGVGIYLTFDLGTGSTYQTTAGSWTAGSYWTTSSATSVIGTLNATWYVTGVQLEVGSVATPFEHRSYGEELALCQRYFYKTYNIDTAVGANTATGIAYLETLADGTLSRLKCFNPRLPVTMRVNPTVTAYSQTGTIDTINVYSNSASTLAVSSIANAGHNSLTSYLQTSTNAVAAQTYACHMTASAEL